MRALQWHQSLCGITLLLATTIASAADAPLRVLFLGDHGHHRPADRFRDLQPEMARRGIELIYTDRLDDLNPQTLGDFRGLVIFANQERISPEQEQALLDYVESGHGFIPLHCASYCFLNSEPYIKLVGAQFQRHETGVFRVEQTDAAHPILDGFQSFESWDETYVHTKHNEDQRTVLEVRKEDGSRPGGGVISDPDPNGEPWTWVRTQGKGRVFYTAWGHDDRTWTNAGFVNLVERGIRWACGDDPQKAGPYQDRPEMVPPSAARPLEFVKATLPVYAAGERWGTMGEPQTQMQSPLDAEESMKHMSVPVGFVPELIASEPAIGKPLAMNWDERGRLWITETYDYPNELQPEGEGRDKIRICEDTDADGQFDKFTVFAEHLSIPASLTFAYGGVIVHQVPDTLFLKDTNGDDVADLKEVLFTGWKTNDTHAGPSNLNYGLDGWYYGMTGYAGFEGRIAGESQRFQTGFYRFQLSPPAAPETPPEVARFEFLRNVNNNAWGVGISEEGILFGSTANGNPSDYMPIANRYYERVRGWSSSVLEGIALDYYYDPITADVRQVDWHGGFTAGAGHALYTARRYPQTYWNRTAFVAEPTGHLIATFTIQPSGAGFRSRNSWNIYASTDGWSAPINAEVGPDGNVWFIDWYNIIVQHNPTPVGYETGKGNAYVSDLRDKTHGRIYRLDYVGEETGVKNASPPFAEERTRSIDLAKASPEQLVAALTHTNFFWRRHAQRLLIERGQADVVPALVKLIETQAPDPGEEFVPAVAHALNVLHALQQDVQADGEPLACVSAALSHASAGVRRNAISILPNTPESLERLEKAGSLADQDGQVKLAALLKIADVPSNPRGAMLVLEAMRDPAVTSDRWLMDAATSAAAAHAVPLLESLASLDAATFENPGIARALTIVGEHLGRAGDAASMSATLAALVKAPRPAVAAVLKGLANGWPRTVAAMLDEQGDAALAEMFEQSDASSRMLLLTLGSRLGTKRLDAFAAELTEAIFAKVRDPLLKDAERAEAARQLIAFRKSDPATALSLLDEVGPQTNPELGQGLVMAVASSDAPEALDALAGRLNTLTPQLQRAAVRGLIGTVAGAKAYLAAVERKEVQLGDLALDQKQALASHPDREVARRAKALLASGGALPDPDRQKVIEQLLSVVETGGDPANGKLVFTKQCSKCHTHSGEGTKIGPDLTGMAVHPRHELLVNILDPSRSVEGNYRAYTIATVEGRVLTGLLASESRTAIELFNSEGKKETLQRSDIDQLVASTKSLMPEGFEKQVTPEELTDLLAFLTQRGKYLPLPIDKVATAVSTRGLFTNENARAEMLVFPDWSPKTFAGVPFVLVDPRDGRLPNVIVLNSPHSPLVQAMPKSVSVLCNSSARNIHLLGGIAGWAHPFGEDGLTSLIVRLHYADGSTEDHDLKNGEEIADYIRRVDVPGSQFAFDLRGPQLRYLSVAPARDDVIQQIEFVKGPDETAPVVFAITVETR